MKVLKSHITTSGWIWKPAKAVEVGKEGALW